MDAGLGEPLGRSAPRPEPGGGISARSELRAALRSRAARGPCAKRELPSDRLSAPLTASMGRKGEKKKERKRKKKSRRLHVDYNDDNQKVHKLPGLTR